MGPIGYLETLVAGLLGSWRWDL